MSRFHEELVAARRRREAPGQAPAVPAAPPPVTFLAIPASVPLVVCSRCGSAVTVDRADYHAEWHIRVGD